MREEVTAAVSRHATSSILPRITAGLAGLCLCFAGVVRAEDLQELQELPVCSAATAKDGTAPAVCSVTGPDGGPKTVRIDLTAQSSDIEVAGFKVNTDNYNGGYLTPVVEAKPGDTVAAFIVNNLDARDHGGSVHGGHAKNPTNLHYFHGGIVTPNNRRAMDPREDDARKGDGDNVYVYLRSSQDPQAGSNTELTTKLLTVPIPGEGQLDARVLEKTGTISHPLGLNWYHSHLHGISSHQVMGGMSGLLSTGDATANVRALCEEDPNDRSKCQDATDALRKRTNVRYVLLRDISLEGITKRPEEPKQTEEERRATWAPLTRDFPEDTPCGVWNGTELSNDPTLRLGFCQRSLETAWLFTLNGQLYPKITIKGGENLLVRLGNVSANVGYLLELKDKNSGTTQKLTVLSLDGVVPASRSSPDQAEEPVRAVGLDDFLLMPASRVEFYVRNDQGGRSERHYVLRTKGLKGIGNDEWPAIDLAELVLEPSREKSDIELALNETVATPLPMLVRAQRVFRSMAGAMFPEEQMPVGCVRDLDPGFKEFRRVTFETTSDHGAEWAIKTEIVRPSGTELNPEWEYEPADPEETTIGPIPFERYDLGDGIVDWTGESESDPRKLRHVCIKIDGPSHDGSHKQLWVLVNSTKTLHNFHIHQMKFRLATRGDLAEHLVAPIDPGEDPSDPESCKPRHLYKCFDDSPMHPGHPEMEPIYWHDTIPVPPLGRVFLVMSYDAEQQIGRFVFHCHILKHEDKGLMAPIEVWGRP